MESTKKIKKGQIEDFISDSTQTALDLKLSNNPTDYTDATTPLAGTEVALVEQGGTFKKVAVSEFGGGGSLVFSDTTTHTHTGTTAYTRLVDLLIPANTIQEGDIWELDIMAKRSTTDFSTNCQLIASISQTDEGNGFVRGVQVGNSNRSQIRVLRTLSFLDGGLYAFNNSGAFFHEFQNISPRALVASSFDKTINNYIRAGFILSNASNIGIIEYVIFRKIN